MRLRPPPSLARQRGFTLIEVAFAGILTVGLSIGLLSTVRYVQMIERGRAAGQQMSRLSEAATRYMKQYGSQISALDAACSTPTVVFRSAASGAPPATAPNCSLTLDNVTVRNGLQPSVSELNELRLTNDANDFPLLLSNRDTTVVKEALTGAPARPRLAILIRRVQDTSTTTPGSGVSGYPDYVLPNGDTLYADTYDLPPSLLGISCYDGAVRETNSNGTGILYYGTPVFFKANQLTEPYTLPQSQWAEAQKNAISVFAGLSTAAAADSALWTPNGYTYCRYIQNRLGLGIFGTRDASGGTAGGSSSTDNTRRTWLLQATVYNTQPYYYEEFQSSALPMGVAAQMGAALESLGYGGRMSALSRFDSPQLNGKMLVGIGGLNAQATNAGATNERATENPVLSADQSEGAPGILAAVSVLADGDQSTQGGGNSSAVSGNASWDSTGNLTRAGLIQADQIAGNTAVVGTGNALPANGRNPVMSVNGDLLMGEKSTIIAQNIEADMTRTSSVIAGTVTADRLQMTRIELGVTSGGGQLYLGNRGAIRLPRAYPGSSCTSDSDLAVTPILGRRPAAAVNYTRYRFTLTCGADGLWGSTDYDAFVKNSSGQQLGWVDDMPSPI